MLALSRTTNVVMNTITLLGCHIGKIVAIYKCINITESPNDDTELFLHILHGCIV